MTYLILTERDSIIDDEFDSYDQAFIEATRLFGEDPMDWVNRNVRIEENR